MSERHRVCAVCGKRHGATYGFHSTLNKMGIRGDKAVPACVQKAAKAYNALPIEKRPAPVPHPQAR